MSNKNKANSENEMFVNLVKTLVNIKVAMISDSNSETTVIKNLDKM